MPAAADNGDGRVVTLFVQLYESSPEAVKSEIATFFDVFPNGIVLGSVSGDRGAERVVNYRDVVDAPPFTLTATCAFDQQHWKPPPPSPD